MKLATRLRQLRREAGYTQPEFGRAVGVHRSRVSRIERGLAYPDILLLMRMAKLLQVRTDYLLGLEEK